MCTAGRCSLRRLLCAVEGGHSAFRNGYVLSNVVRNVDDANIRKSCRGRRTVALEDIGGREGLGNALEANPLQGSDRADPKGLWAHSRDGETGRASDRALSAGFRAARGR